MPPPFSILFPIENNRRDFVKHIFLSPTLRKEAIDRGIRGKRALKEGKEGPSLRLTLLGYLLQLVRYIHRNPLQTGLVGSVDAYERSSHQGYVSEAKKRRLYRHFIAKQDSGEISQIFEGKKLASVLGSGRFIDWVNDRSFHQKKHEEIPESRLLAPDREKIKHLVCKTYHVSEGDVLKSKRGPLNEARNVAMYLTRRLRGDGLDRICEEFHLNCYSSPSNTIERVRVQISKDPELRGGVFSLDPFFNG